MGTPDSQSPTSFVSIADERIRRRHVHNDK